MQHLCRKLLRNFVVLMAAIFALSNPSSSYAGMVSSIATMSGPGGFLVFDDFDSSLGDLTGIGLKYELHTHASGICAFPGPDGATCAASIEVELVGLDLFGGLVEEAESPSVSWPVGVLEEFGGDILVPVHPLTVPDLMGFVDTGSGFVEGIAWDLFPILTEGEISIVAPPEAGSTATLTYTYTPSVVPIPAALPLFASALIGFGFVARRRRKAQAA